MALAAAAVGCSGSGSGASSGGKKGVDGQTFRLSVRGETAVLDPSSGTTIVLPGGGVVTSSVGGIDCGIVGTSLHKVCEARLAYGTTGVALFAVPNDSTWVYGWAGACAGRDACLVDITSDRLVNVRFSSTVQGLTAHPNFRDTTPGCRGPARPTARSTRSSFRSRRPRTRGCARIATARASRGRGSLRRARPATAGRS